MERKPVALKFGGTSVATAESRRMLIGQVRKVMSEGYFPVLVVSAMGRRGAPYATDTLIDLMRAEGEPVDGRDEDLIYHCGEVISSALVSHILKQNGLPAVALTGFQAGVYTDGRSRRAKITRIDPTRMLRHIAAGEIPVVTGGQGGTYPDGEITILGRGASDTSGVAVGVAVGAEKVIIFSDVHGVAAADPRVVPEARYLTEISYNKMYQMGIFGSKVVHPGAVLIGQRGRTKIVCRSTFDDLPGTTITETQMEPDLVGIASLSPVRLLEVSGEIVPCLEPEELFDQFTAVILRGKQPTRAVVAAAPDWAGSVQKWLWGQGAEVEMTGTDWGIVSLVGKPEFIQDSFEQALSALAGLGIDSPLQELGYCRSSFVAPTGETARIVRCFYDTFGAAIQGL